MNNAQLSFLEDYKHTGVAIKKSLVFEVPANKHGVYDPVNDVNTSPTLSSSSFVFANATFDASNLTQPRTFTLQNVSGTVTLQAGTLTSTRVPFADSSGRLVDDPDLTFITDTLSATKLKSSFLTAGRVTFAGTGGLLVDDADFTFATDTLTATKFATTQITDSGLTATRVIFAGVGGLLSDDADMTFVTDTLTVVNISISGIINSFSITDAKNISLGTTTGTKIGTAANQKIGFWNAAPVVQPTTAGAAATFTANTSGIVDDSATFDGYTIGQVVKALRTIGVLA